MTPRRTLRATRALALVLAAAVALTACSSDDDDGDAAGDATTTTTVADGEQEVEVELDSTGEAWSRTVPEEPIATAPSSVDGLELELYLAERSGEAVTLVWALHNTTEEESGLSASTYFIESTAPAAERTMSGISIVDPVELRQHLVFRIDDGSRVGACVCSSSEGVHDIEPGARYFAMGVVSAPPTSTEAVSVLTPIGAFTDVALTDVDSGA